jgi:hypothetical protein
MKFPSKEELNEYTEAIAIGGLKGAAVGSLVSGGLFLYARKRLPNYAQYGVFARTFSLMAPPVLFGMTNIEFASRRFEEQRYGYGDYSAENLEKQKQFDNLTTWQQMKTIAINNKYKMITGAWAASLAGSFWIINRDKLMTKSQKIVQARMYAQGLTVIILLATMALTVSAGEQRKRENEVQNQEWVKIADAEEKREIAQHIPTHLSERKKISTQAQA